MLQLKNTTPLAATISVFPNRDGIDTLFVVVKGTFSLKPKIELIEKQVPPVLADEYFDEPGTSSLKYASEMHLAKPSTDVVLIGSAWAPGGRKVTDSVVTLAVAGRQKVVRVVGNRKWKGYSNGFSSPEPFEWMPLVYERAFGGIHRDGERILAEERNPVGVGFPGKRSAMEMSGQPLPNLEDPRKPISKFGDVSPPACFGFVAPSWLPRRTFAGTYDETWKRKQAPYLPKDFDQRFLNAASSELTFDRYLKGGEPVSVIGASREGQLRFNLPQCNLSADVKIAARKEQPPLNLETVLIEPDNNRVSLTWRGEVPCDKQALKVEEIALHLDGLSRHDGRPP
jgi:hypothetical protein